VNAGKGLTDEDACAGAYMECIEYAFAQPGASRVRTVRATARDVLDGATRKDAVLDFCPRIAARVALDEPLECVWAEGVAGPDYLVPAELVFMPFSSRTTNPRLLGSGSNGLAAGNTVLEASIHALFELIERNVRSFQCSADTSSWVVPETFPSELRALWQSLKAGGFDLAVRSAPNPFSVVYFEAMLWERGNFDPLSMYGGFGCHVSPAVALTRAITEAMQSRLSFIHGARDDLTERYNKFAGWPGRRALAYGRRLAAKMMRRKPRLEFESLGDAGAECQTVEEGMAFLLEALRRQKLERVLRVVFTEPADSVQAVRVIVPKLEHFRESTQRIGKRLRDHARAA